MPHLFIAVWAVGTQSMRWTERDLVARCVELERALEAAEARRQLAPDDPMGIFVAPEYMFSMRDDDRPEDGRFQLDAAGNQALKVRLAALSNQFGSMLLVPGSVAFSKSIDLDDTGSRKRVAKWYNQLRKHQVALASGRVNPPGLGGERQAHTDKMRALATRVRDHKKRGTGATLRIARNCAYGYWRGQKVFACRKRTELGEIFPGDDTFYINAGDSTRWAQGGVTFGVEICKDAADGYLRLVAGADVDVQIVLSASLGIEHIRRCARKYIIHGAQQEVEAGVFDRFGSPMGTAGTTTIDGFRLSYYLVDLTVD